MKKCSKCKKLKDESEFYKNNRHKNGLQSKCKNCTRKYARKYHGHLKKYLIYEDRHRVIDNVKQKKCSKCKKWNAESDFYKRHSYKDGLALWCKECSNKATNKAHKQRLAGIEKA